MLFVQSISKFTSVVLISSALLLACSAPTKIQSSWQDPMYNAPPFSSLAVLALMEDEASSREFERQAAHMLRQKDIEVVEGRASLNTGKDMSYQQLEDALKNNGTEGILIFKLIAVDSDYAYQPPTMYRLDAPFTPTHPRYSYYYPRPYYFPYWHSGLQVTTNPGYWSEREYYVIETALYDNKTDRLVWIATSKTYAPEETKELSKSILTIVNQRLTSENFIAMR